MSYPTHHKNSPEGHSHHHLYSQTHSQHPSHKLQKNLQFFLIIGIIAVAIFIAIVIFSIQKNKSIESSPEESKEVEGTSQIKESKCVFDSECKVYGENYVCISGKCSTQGGTSEQNASTGRTRTGLLGFFANFLTGSTVSGAGDVIYYDKGYVGIGTSEPNGTFEIKSMHPDSTIRAKQGKTTFYTSDGDFVYDGGNDGKYLFINKNSSGITEFRTPGYALLTIKNKGEIIVPPNGAKFLIGNDSFRMYVQPTDTVLQLLSTTASYLSVGTDENNRASVVLASSDHNSYNGLVSWEYPLKFFTEGQERMVISKTGEISVNNLKGTGNRYVCVNSEGTIYASSSSCT
ncbi:MAG: hypothetical protein KatS3mg001_114 [Candidatus Pacearchaeota archaeon]|nr:MAG: hypothetical protein KatS3mg001_114 [Candidatus Pacearchaeota archaeon]